MTGNSDPTTSRRALLGTGLATLASAVAGCQWRADPGSEESPAGDRPTAGSNGTENASETANDTEKSSVPRADEFETVVDLVADAGADPNGEESILPLLEEYAGPDTLLYFPEGEYRMDGMWRYPTFENLGIVGENATIVPEQGYNNYLFILGIPGEGSRGLVFEGFEFDFTDPETHPRPIQVQATGDFLVQDVVARGSSGTARFDVTEEGGSGVVRRLELPDGGMEPNPVGVLVGPENVGELTFEDCHVEGFPGNGLYASPSNGPVNVHGGYYANSGIANVRVSGPTEVRDVHVRCDRAPDGFRNMRGIRLRHGESALVENCTVEMLEVTYSEGAVVVEPSMESPTIRDLDVEVAADGVAAINAKSPLDAVAKPAIECENVRIDGGAGDGAAIRVVDRDECLFESVEVTQSGPDRDGLHFIRSHDATLRDVHLDVTGDPFVLEQSDVERTDVSIE